MAGDDLPIHRGEGLHRPVDGPAPLLLEQLLQHVSLRRQLWAGRLRGQAAAAPHLIQPQVAAHLIQPAPPPGVRPVQGQQGAAKGLRGQILGLDLVLAQGRGVEIQLSGIAPVQLLQRARLHSAPPFLSIQRLSRKKVTLSPASCITQFIFCKTAQFPGGFPVIFAILFFSLAFLEKTDYNSSIVEARGLSPAFIAQIRPPAGQAPRKGVWQYGIYLYQFVSPGCL